jgi:NAD-dependent dihydropyrimidine dehydrogenase PreA subunit
MSSADAPANGARDGLFINLEVELAAASDPELAAKLAEVCPVDIFTASGGRVEIIEENLDECVLCELCINAAPAGAVRVVKLYSGESLPA